jgi:hypothetical protein
MPLLLFVVSLQPEVGELLLGYQVACRRRVRENAVLDGPGDGVVARLRVEGVEGLAVEEIDRLAEGVLRVRVARRPLWRTDADEMDRPVGGLRGADELPALERGPELRAGLLVAADWQLEDQLLSLHGNTRERHRAAAPVEERAGELSALLGDLEPVDAVGVLARAGQIPASEKALRLHSGSGQHDGDEHEGGGDGEESHTRECYYVAAVESTVPFDYNRGGGVDG